MSKSKSSAELAKAAAAKIAAHAAQKAEAAAATAARKRQRDEADQEARRMSGQGCIVTRDKRTGEILGAYRMDVVKLMHNAGAITQDEVNAVRNLEALIDDASERSGSSLASLDRVSGADVTSRTMSSIIRHTDAAVALTHRQDRMDPLTWRLLRDLCDGNLILTRWRQTIERHTGETNEKAQSGIIRQAFRVLAAVEEAIHRRIPANDTRAPTRTDVA